MQETTNLQKTMSIQACTERVQKIVAISYPCAKAYVHSFGCQLNVSDGEKIKGLLQSMGFSLTETHEDADVIVFNTCAVRESAEDRVYGMLGVMKKYKETHPRTILILSGCMGSEPKTLEKVRAHYSFIDILMGTASIGELPRLLATYYDTKKFVYDMDSTAMPSEQMQQVRNSGFKASVPIMYGCNNFCTYCIVPYVRGRERSRQPEVILREVQHLIQDGYKEIMLLGQNVNSYRAGEVGFPELIRRVADVSPLLRVRFATSHPKDMSDRLLEVMASMPNICRAIHLPAQSGATSMLERMNRKYTREWYLGRVAAIRRYLPDCAVTTDLIAGFSGETEKEHEATLSLMREVGYEFAYMFKYSERPGTFAHEHLPDDVPDEVKSRRLSEIIALQNELGHASNLRDVGREFEVLVEGRSKRDEKQLSGRTSQNKVVVFDRGRHDVGDYVRVRITGCTPATLFGEEII